MADLPQSYCDTMKEMLQEEYEEYLASFQETSHTAFRVNTHKISVAQWEKINPFSTGVVPWCEKGFYYSPEKDRPSLHPYYYAGLFYIQEPSAMIPASLLPVASGDRILDLCAAPGGKATELGSRLDGTGFLVANDISASRAMALTKNLQMAGIYNCMVTAETPKRLGEVFTEYFDKILIDAPCSGEGMFRREPGMIKDWLKKGPEEYSRLQREILCQAYKMLRPGGMLLYSTCTFSPREDEEVIGWMLGEYPDMHICPVERKEGFSPGMPEWISGETSEILQKRGTLQTLQHCVRIFPHRAKGEGHFAVLLQKGEQKEVYREWGNNERELSGQNGKDRNRGKNKRNKKVRENTILDRKLEKQIGEGAGEIESFLQELSLPEGSYTWQKDTLTWHSLKEPAHTGLRVIYGGLPICKWKHKVIPTHQLALVLSGESYSNSMNLSSEGENIIRYLKGETLQMEKTYRGNVLVCVDGYGVGWCQGNGTGMLKNKYHPGWRYNA